MAVSAASQVLNVSVTEKVYQQVLYNPLKNSAGLWKDAHENQTQYYINGTIVVKNTHATGSVEHAVINFTSVSKVYNVKRVLGRQANISKGALLSLFIPDLGPGQNVTFTYNVNTTTVQPVLNFTTTYSVSKVFTGNSFTVSDIAQNTGAICVYNINVTHNAFTKNIAGN